MIHIKKPDVFLLAINVMSSLVDTVDELKYLSTNNPIVSVDINYDVVLGTVRVAQVPDVKGISLVHAVYECSAILYERVSLKVLGHRLYSVVL